MLITLNQEQVEQAITEYLAKRILNIDTSVPVEYEFVNSRGSDGLTAKTDLTDSLRVEQFQHQLNFGSTAPSPVRTVHVQRKSVEAVKEKEIEEKQEVVEEIEPVQEVKEHVEEKPEKKVSTPTKEAISKAVAPKDETVEGEVEEKPKTEAPKRGRLFGGK